MSEQPSHLQILFASLTAVVVGTWAFLLCVLLVFGGLPTTASGAFLGVVAVIILAPTLAIFVMPFPTLAALLLCMAATWLLAVNWRKPNVQQRLAAVASGSIIGAVMAQIAADDWGSPSVGSIGLLFWLPAGIAAMLAAHSVLRTSIGGGIRGYRG